MLQQSFTGKHVYIHVPVCRYRCDYCDFFSRIHVAHTRQQELIQRIAVQADTLIDFTTCSPLETLYIGGGTPSALAPDAWEELLRLILRLVSRSTGGHETLIATAPGPEAPGPDPEVPAPEVTVELNPEDITETRCRELRAAGANRLSVGVQTFSPEAIRTIGRHTGGKDTWRGLETLAEHWDREWSADLIVGIPGESAATVRRDIQTLLSFQPRHLSVYELSIEPATVLGHASLRGRVHAAKETDVLAQLRIAAELLENAGFRRYEISSYAHPGAESRHNLAYWRMAPHLGLGPGAVGTFPFRGPTSPAEVQVGTARTLPAGTAHRVTTTRSFERFLRRSDFGMEIEPLSAQDVVKEYCMMAFRTVEGIDTASFRKRAGAPFTEVCAATVAAWPDAFIPAQRITTPSVPADGPATGIAIAEPYRNVIDRILVDLFADIDTIPR
ncbi:MAG: coproporphyrinogen-III oxidase family protein [Spirochaeta sp.]|jgi:oxygen-independent coproporphyrinogen-3 oxidase|nr:coproporphyrinogen-III oxidase family protein [Spirochaeta sp.]